ncbi:MAG: TetR/AcrR family transcriptional regulator [Clostridia bacterium]|nr:TetR/AcrR family transcriptional regulator [Clostridia bacterium]
MKKQQNVRDIKGEFLESSFNYLVKNGLENTSVRDLCRGTGISTGSVYYWFENKDDLFISTAEYGLMKVVNSIFEYVFETIHDHEYFFKKSLDELGKYARQLRLIYQMATSPVYGDRLRKKSAGLDDFYAQSIERIAKEIKVSVDDLTPIIFMYISVILDYMVWDDKKVTQMQIDYLYEILKSKMNG